MARTNTEVAGNRVSVPARPILVHLPYTPPYDWETVLWHYRIHELPHLEAVDEEGYERLIETSRGMGWLRVTHAPKKHSLKLQIWHANREDSTAIVSTIRRMFDLDSDRAAISAAMNADPSLSKIWQHYPGLRVSRSWNGFESMVTTILGQLVSVAFGRVLTSELMDAAGSAVTHPKTRQEIRLFPTAEQLLKADLSRVRTSESRRIAIRSLATLVKDGTLQWDKPIAHDQLRKILLSVPGIGPWTAEYVAMHGFHDDDAFPATDYALKQELKRHPTLDVKKVRPWRAYATVALWKNFFHSK